MVTIPTTALEDETGGIKYTSLKLVKLIDVPPAQDSVEKCNAKDHLNGAGDCDHEEIPAVDDIVQVSGDEVVDLPDKVFALLPCSLLLLSLDARLVYLWWGGFGGEGCGGAFDDLGAIR